MGGVGGGGNRMPKFLAQKLGKDFLRDIAGRRCTGKYCLNCGSTYLYYRKRTNDIRCKECGWIEGALRIVSNDLQGDESDTMVEILGLKRRGDNKCL